MLEVPRRIAILGAGAWGTGLACALAPRRDVVLWTRDPAHAQSLAGTRENPRYLPGVRLPTSVSVTHALATATGADLLIAATPVAALSGLLEQLRAQTGAGAPPPLLWLCKGFEQGSGRLPHQIVDAVLGASHPSGALSGPSFAIEVARGLPCALTLASRDTEFARTTAAALHGARLRVYYGTDLVGVEVGGAVKNVMAIAVGLCDGLGLGQNARAALIARGLAEMMRLGVALGGVPETLMGLTGAGDLILTATGDLSRNRRVGIGLARGETLAEILQSLGHVAEGVRAAREVLRLAQTHGLDMPISAAVAAVIDERLSPQAAVERLLARDAKEERL